MSPQSNNNELLPALEVTRSQLTNDFNQISEERRYALRQLTDFIQSKVNAGQKIFLNFICTHNSRRSHFSQLWAQVAAHYYQLPGVECYSGGVETTAFNPRAVKAMQYAGFNIIKMNEDENPLYAVRFSDHANPISAFSKKYDDSPNPRIDFAAIMTCSHAAENCPLVSGSLARFTITYDDPKDFDNTSLESAKYKETVEQIGREILFAFSQVNSRAV